MSAPSMIADVAAMLYWLPDCQLSFITPFLEVVEARHEIVRAQALGRKEVRGLDEPIPVVAMFEPPAAADGTERRRVEAGIVRADGLRAIRNRCALHQIGEARSSIHRGRDLPRVLTLEEEVLGEDARVIGRVQILIRRIVIEARHIHDGAEPVVRHLRGPLRVPELGVVLGVQRVSDLAFVASLVRTGWVVESR